MLEAKSNNGWLIYPEPSNAEELTLVNSWARSVDPDGLADTEDLPAFVLRPLFPLLGPGGKIWEAIDELHTVLITENLLGYPQSFIARKFGDVWRRIAETLPLESVESDLKKVLPTYMLLHFLTVRPNSRSTPPFPVPTALPHSYVCEVVSHAFMMRSEGFKTANVTIHGGLFMSLALMLTPELIGVPAESGGRTEEQHYNALSPLLEAVSALAEKGLVTEPTVQLLLALTLPAMTEGTTKCP